MNNDKENTSNAVKIEADCLLKEEVKLENIEKH